VNTASYLANLEPATGSEQGGVRPVLVIQNDTGNRYSPTIIVAGITGQLKSPDLPTHVLLTVSSCGLPKASLVMLEQLRTLDRKRLQMFMGRIRTNKMREIDAALAVSVGLAD